MGAGRSSSKRRGEAGEGGEEVERSQKGRRTQAVEGVAVAADDVEALSGLGERERSGRRAMKCVEVKRSSWGRDGHRGAGCGASKVKGGDRPRP